MSQTETRPTPAQPESEHLAPFGYQPELDGLRTIAVYLVVAYHAGLSIVSNGYLGVDVFFVLSGFLVTNVLVTELNDHGRIRFARFYARRVRRLLPAASATILATVLAMRFAATPAQRAAIEGDAQAAALWFANFNALDRIRDGIVDPSPLLHFWSLSIEEQYYVLFPLALLALWFLTTRRLTTAAWVMAGLTAVFAAVQVLVNRADWDAAYYVTHARTYQMLAGATLALLMRTGSRWLPQLPRFAAEAALGLVVFLSLGVNGLGGASLRGAAVTGLMLVVLLGLGQGPSPATSLLSAGPMVYLGQISYAVYLFHVPVGVVTEYATGPLNPWVKLAYTAAVSTALAAVSAKVLEAPIRHNATLDRNHPAVIIAGLASAAVVAFVLVPILS